MIVFLFLTLLLFLSLSLSLSIYIYIYIYIYKQLYYIYNSYCMCVYICICNCYFVCVCVCVCVCVYIYIYIATLKSSVRTKQSVCRWQYIRSPMGVEHSGEFSAAARIMQSSSKELSTLVADRIKNVNKRLLLLLHKYLNNSHSQTWYTCWPSGLRLSLT